MPDRSALPDKLSFIAGDGEMARRIRGYALQLVDLLANAHRAILALELLGTQRLFRR